MKQKATQYTKWPASPRDARLFRVLKTVALDVLVFVLAILLNVYVVRLSIVRGSSMENTLHDRDFIVLWQLEDSYRTGDIIVTKEDNAFQVRLAKRVIASEGQYLELSDNTVYVDGILLDEPYVKETPWLAPDIAMEIPPGHVFIMGDNRNASADSRDIGCIPIGSIQGRAVLRVFPFSRAGFL